MTGVAGGTVRAKGTSERGSAGVWHGSAAVGNDDAAAMVAYCGLADTGRTIAPHHGQPVQRGQIAGTGHAAGIATGSWMQHQGPGDASKTWAVTDIQLWIKNKATHTSMQLLFRK